MRTLPIGVLAVLSLSLFWNSVALSQEHDTSTCNEYLALGEELYINNPDTAVILWQQVRSISQDNLTSSLSPILRKKYSWCLAEAVSNIGYIYHYRGDLAKGLEYYRQGLNMRKDIGDKEGIATSLNNIGAVYSDQGDIQKGLEYYFKSLKIEEELGNKEGVAISLNNIGRIYKDQDDFEKGLEYYFKSLDIREEIGDKYGVGNSLNNIGMLYEDQGDIDRALEYYFKALKIKEEIGDKDGAANSLNNIGVAYYGRHDIKEALEYFRKSLNIKEEIGDKRGVATSLNNIGYISLYNGDLISAKQYAQKMLDLAQKLGVAHYIKDGAALLAKVHKAQGNFKESLEMYELFVHMRDSIKNEETLKATIRQQIKYEFEKEQLIKEQEEVEKTRVEAEITARRDNLQYSVILIFLLALFGGVLSLGFIKVSPKMAEGIIFFAFLILFEFLLVLADPYIEKWSGNAPAIKLLFNAGIAALIFPLHSFFDKKLKYKLLIPK